MFLFSQSIFIYFLAVYIIGDIRQELLNTTKLSFDLIYNKTINFGKSEKNGALRNVEYPLIAIASRSTLIQSGSTW